MTKRLHKLQHL